MSNKERYFNGVRLVENLYPDSRKREGKWRYRWPDRWQNFDAKTVQQANAIATEANQERDQQPQAEAPENALQFWAEKYIDHREGIDPNLEHKSAWKSRNRAAIREFSKTFKGVPVFQLSLRHIRPWWDGLTGNAQRNKKPELNRFCNHLIAEEITPNLQPHPFDILMMRPTGKKARLRMSIDDYWEVYHKAPEVGLDYIQDAMALALLTFMRRGDLCNLRFNEHTNGKSLWKLISKATAQGKPKRLIWHFDEWPELRKVIKRCRERSMQHQRCPYLLSRSPERLIMGEEKTHSHQVLPGKLSDDFATVRDATGLYDHVPPIQRPGIHEIRSTGSHLHEDVSDEDDLMNAMAHSDIEMTRHYQSGHVIQDIEIGIKELPIRRMGGEF